MFQITSLDRATIFFLFSPPRWEEVLQTTRHTRRVHLYCQTHSNDIYIYIYKSYQTMCCCRVAANSWSSDGMTIRCLALLNWCFITLCECCWNVTTTIKKCQVSRFVAAKRSNRAPYIVAIFIFENSQKVVVKRSKMANTCIIIQICVNWLSLVF